MTRKQLHALAAAVASRRHSLGLTQADLSSRGGPGVVTVGKIERAEVDSPLATTLQGLDRSLRWKEGSAAGVLQGHPPRELAEDEGSAAEVIEAIRNDPNLLPEAKEHLEKQYGLLLRVQAAAKAEGARHPEDVKNAELRSAQKRAMSQPRTAPRKRRT